MDRISRYINNRKQDKIRMSNSRPSLQSLREGEEVLYINKDNKLCRYRKEKGILWKSEMSHDGNHIVEKDLKIRKNLSVSKDIHLDGTIKFDNGVDITTKATGGNETLSITTEETVGSSVTPDGSLKVYINGTLYQIPVKEV
jgi:hypothetical protein|tara:strand:- start:818 stop:1243 length:426 start_codon:yes stop_codon:yes gene_type:complete